MKWTSSNKPKDKINYLIPFYAPKDMLTYKEIELITSLDPKLTSPSIYNDGGYVNYSESLISGFSNRTYFSLDEEAILETIENNSSIEFDKNDKEVLEEGVIYSDFSCHFNGGVDFVPLLNKSSLNSGREPLDLDEIVVSSGLLKNLTKSNTTEEFLYISTATKEINKDLGIYYRDYETVKLKIVGVINNGRNSIYHNCNWTTDFFVLKNGQPISKLFPTSVSFEIEKEADIERLSKKLNIAFPQYDISNPLLDINESIDSLCNSISLFVMCVSGVSLVISLMLLSSCTYLHIQDIKKEIALARCIGISSKESKKFIYGYTIYTGTIALLVSSLELVLSNFLVSFMSSNILSLPFEFSIAPQAFLIMMIGCVLISCLSSFMSTKHISKIRPTDCLKI